MAYYGNHPEFGEQKFLLAADVVAAFDDEVDFSLYDTVVIVHAGAGEETDVLGDSPEQIYSGYLSPEDFEAAVEEEILAEAWIPATDADGGEVRLTQFLILPETEYQDPASAPAAPSAPWECTASKWGCVWACSRSAISLRRATPTARASASSA